ncbi:pimeloyl-ACP methyl ester carboxylesterase, partial [Actinoalloteichus hoggarensis]
MNRRRDVRRGATLLAVLGLSGALIGVPAATADEGTAPATPLAWGECPADVPNDPPLLQCATVPVPLDYGDPDGERIEIMISRLPSFNPEQRRGILLLNPGGPGGSGLDLSTLLSSQGLPNSVLAGYDLIGVDPRGVGHSAPVSCGFTADDTDYFGNIPPYAVDEAAVAEQARIAQGVAEQCAANDVDGRLRHLSTANTARDLDSIRAALGEEKASFLGYSYGSALGAAYASMFPDTADRVVLDSNIGDTHLDYEGIRRFGLGLEEMFPDFADWAAARHDSYELGSTPEEVRETYFDIAERLDENPVEGVVDGTLFRLATFGGLYREASYGRTAQLWQSVSVSDPAAQDVLALLDADLPVLPSGPPTGASEPSAFDNSWSAFLAVTCNDAEWPEDVETYQRGVAE